MRKIYFQISFVIVFFVNSTFVFSQPNNIYGNFGLGWGSTDLVDRGVVKSALITSISNTNATYLFTNSAGNYNPKWSGSNLNFSRTVDTFHDGSAYYCAGCDWSKDLETVISSGKYYTFIIDGMNPSSTSNRSMSILETSYYPVSISSVAQTPVSNVKNTEPVVVTATLGNAKNVEEKVFIRYTIDAWTTSNFIEITSFNGSNQGSATIPAQVVGKTVEYYVLTTKQSNPDALTIDYFSLNINNNGGSNYSYTVVEDLSTPKITISDDGNITENAENAEIITITLENDVFEASLNLSNWTITNLPAGVTAGSISRISNTQATITLLGNSTIDYDVDITNLTVSVSNLELVTLFTGTIFTNTGVTFKATIENSIWMHLLTSDNFVQNLGDNPIWINAEVGQTTWDGTQIGYGLLKTDTTGWKWLNATWYADGTGNNKKVHAEVTLPTISGTYYYVARGRALITDKWTYANDTTWTDAQMLSAKFTITMNALSAPTFCVATAINASKIDLSWIHNPIHQTVVVLAKSGSSISANLINGTTYNVGDVVGDAKVIYKGTAESFSHTGLTASTQYHYNFYSENYNNYSSAVSVNATTLDISTCNFQFNLGDDVAVCGGGSIKLDPGFVVSPFADSLVINFNANYGLATLAGATKVYVHAGAEINNSTSWDFTVGNWGLDDGIGKMKNIGSNLWQITIHPQTYFGYEKGVFPTSIFVVFRNADGTLKADNGAAGDIKISMSQSTPTSNYGSVTTGKIESEYSSILWSTGSTAENITVEEAGIYFATVTKSDGCADSDTIEVKIGSIPMIDIGSGGVLCGGESIYLVAQNTFTTYKWQDNSTNDSLLITTGGTYSVTVTNSDGCTGFDVVNYSTSDIPTADFSFEITDLTAIFTNLSSLATIYAWDFDGNGSTDNTTVNPTKIYVTKGNYNVTLKVTNSCGTNSKTQNIIITNVDLLEKSNSKIYPNPVSDILNIEIENNSDVIISVKDILGKEIYSTKEQSMSNIQFQTINFSNFTNGTYILEVKSNNQNISKLIIKK